MGVFYFVNKTGSVLLTPNRPLSEEIHYYDHIYCIIFGQPSQAEQTFRWLLILYSKRRMINMPTAKKLPSGSWRCQVFSHYEEVKQEDGSVRKKRIYKSFTSDDALSAGKKAAELAATQ